MISCCVLNCDATPFKGTRFYRVLPLPERLWVCHKHFEEVEMDPALRALHLRWNDFFTQARSGK